jgi:EAL domain-containing protein (putative c-di-GMP-specific phosphodiesterase class I)
MSLKNLIGASNHNRQADSDVIQDALRAVREHLDMEIAYFSEFVDGQSVFRRVDAPGLEHLIKVGDSRSLNDVYCTHIIEGRLPELIPDTAQVPFAQRMPITSAVPIGSHASIPIRRPDGTTYGMFCCLSPRANPSLNKRDLATMRVFAGLATKQLHLEIEQGRAEREKRAAVERIIDQGAFEIAFQPIVELVSLQLVSLEALCRFKAQPYRSPDKWFGDASEVGLGLDLELAAIRAAVARFPHLPDGIGLSLNTSPDLVLSGRLGNALDERFLTRTTVEVTEHVRVLDYAAIHRELAPLRAAGVKVAIDDAGAGYSGLQHIVQMNPDVIKIDMSLTRGIDEDRARRALASAMVFYARETGSTVIAEGIETTEELLTLKMLGIARGQGYLLGKPAPLSAAVLPKASELRLSA